jgi:hypothetical protein
LEVGVEGQDFDALVAKAERLKAKRASLEVQLDTLLKQAKDIESGIIKEFGENYMDTFNRAVEAVNQWDEAHAET